MLGSFKGDIWVSNIDVDMDTDPDMAVSIHVGGPFKGVPGLL